MFKLPWILSLYCIVTSVVHNKLYNKMNLLLKLQLLSEEINHIKEQRDKNS